MTDYIKTAHTVLTKAKTLIEEEVKWEQTTSEEEKKKWEHVVTTEGTELYKKEMLDVCPVPCYLARTVIKKPLKTLVDKLWIIDEKTTKINDPSVKEWKELEKTENHKVCSQYNKMGMFIWDRHVVYAQVKIEEPDTGKTYIVAFSVTHPLAPFDEKNYVLGKVHMSVFELKKDTKDESGNSTVITKLAHIDPCGDLPVSVINMFASTQVEMFNRWKKEE